MPTSTKLFWYAIEAKYAIEKMLNSVKEDLSDHYWKSSL
jgi:hypothetical protein